MVSDQTLLFLLFLINTEMHTYDFHSLENLSMSISIANLKSGDLIRIFSQNFSWIITDNNKFENDSLVSYRYVIVSKTIPRESAIYFSSERNLKKSIL